MCGGEVDMGIEVAMKIVLARNAMDSGLRRLHNVGGGQNSASHFHCSLFHFCGPCHCFICELQAQVQDQMWKSRKSGSVLEVLQYLLQQVQVRSFWDFRKQERVSLLQGPQELPGQGQVPLRAAILRTQIKRQRDDAVLGFIL
ncbi:hypothetical protein Ancab_009252 [Ancistrocladus abbreviatus]